jgi:hypothetical protein
MSPEDTVFFDPERVARLENAVADLSWLLHRGYAPKAALELVGNHYQLSQRERMAAVHTAWHGPTRRPAETEAALEGALLCIDGFNLLITLETALGGGVILRGMDGCYRDIADIHGSYSLRQETEKAIALTARALRKFGVASARWLFDRPVSNSGRLAALVNRIAAETATPMQAETTDGVDRKIKACPGVAVTADSEILDSGCRWFDLAGWIIRHDIPEASVVDLRGHRTDVPA